MTGFQGKKILLLDGLTSQCLEYVKAFNDLGCDTTVLCNDRFDTAYASRYPRHKILGVSCAEDLKGTEEWIEKLVCSGDYDVVLPFTDYSAAILSRHKTRLSNYAHCIVNSQEVLDIAQNKNEVMKVCMQDGIPCPKTLCGVRSIDDVCKSDIQFPIILKPCRGFGSHGIRIIKTKEDLSKVASKNNFDISGTVVQEYIPQGSLNVAENLFIDKKGEIKSSFTYASYRTFPINGGSGILNVTINRDDVHKTAARISERLQLRGPVGIDMIIDSRDDTPKILEVNLRPIACSKVGFLAGVNQAQQVLEDVYCDSVTPMLDYEVDIRVRRSHIDWMWFLRSPDRFKASPSWFDRRNTTDQLFSWKDPGPWLAFFIYGLKKYLKERKRS